MRRPRKRSTTGSRQPAALPRLVYPALAETFLAGGRIDFAARFCWLLDLLDPRAITARANNFGKNLTRLFYSDQSSEQNTKLNYGTIAADREGGPTAGV
jgi:hypothetical protein